MTQTLLFDIESTGLLRRGSQIHCIVTRDINNPDDIQVYDHREDQTLCHGIEVLNRVDALVGHNIIGYDVPLIKEAYDFDFQGQLVDTLVLSRLFYPDLKDRDHRRQPAGMPKRLYASHSLEAWGHRLKCFKGDYGKHDGAWDTYTPEMLDYCIQDTMVTFKVYQLMMRRMQDYV
mgnify:CR=1 FL=1